MEPLTSAGFDHYYATHHRALERYLYSIVQDHELAADLAQDTFMKAWRALAAGTIVTTRSWLYQIARNCAVDALRRRKKITWLTFFTLAGASGDASPLALADTGAQARFDQALADREAIAQILARLSSAERTCLIRAISTSAEVCASQLGISLPAFKMRLGRARRHFAALWQQAAAA